MFTLHEKIFPRDLQSKTAPDGAVSVSGGLLLCVGHILMAQMSRVDAPGRRSVLVVDDDPGLQGLFTTLLGRDGYAVDCAPTGRQAFEYLRRGSYSVILLD